MGGRAKEMRSQIRINHRMMYQLSKLYRKKSEVREEMMEGENENI